MNAYSLKTTQKSSSKSPFDVNLRQRSMVLSIILHGLFAVGLFAFDGLSSKVWKKLGANSTIEVEMVQALAADRKKSPIPPKPVAKEVLAETEPTVSADKLETAVASSSTPSVGNSSAEGHGTNSAVGQSESSMATAEINYLNDLRQLLESKKEYPIAARRMGHRGRVVVRFVLERDGRIRTAEIVQPSPSAILNRAARGLIEGLHDVKPFPKEVALSEWAVVVPIEYQM